MNAEQENDMQMNPPAWTQSEFEQHGCHWFRIVHDNNSHITVCWTRVVFPPRRLYSVVRISFKGLKP
jgi:hypothetical protein